MRYNLLNSWPKITIEISNKPETLKNRIIHRFKIGINKIINRMTIKNNTKYIHSYRSRKTKIIDSPHIIKIANKIHRNNHSYS
jgi:hypothetical protein